MTDTAFNYRQAINPYETHFTQTVLPDSGSPGAAAMFLPVDVNDLVASSNPISNPIMAQPLYVSGITVTSPIQGTCNPCNMVVIVTLNGTIYAYVADGTSAGNLLWSRQGTSWISGVGGNALWYGDCGSSGTPVPRIDTIPFEGILSTPVIDASASVPLLYVTSFCETSAPVFGWYLHQINLKNGHDVSTANIGTDVRALSGCTPCSSFLDANQQQRPPLPSWQTRTTPAATPTCSTSYLALARSRTAPTTPITAGWLGTRCRLPAPLSRWNSRT
jgi:hypothetical protein